MRNWILRSLALYGTLCTLCGCVATVNPTPTQPSAEDLVSAINTLIQTPQPLPEFIRTIEPEPGSTLIPSETIYVMVYQGALWEPWNLAPYLQTHIVKTTVISIDYQQIPVQVFDAVFGPGVDDNGELTDRFFSPVQFEFTPNALPHIEKGSHLATIQTSSLSGAMYDYSWVFIVDE